MPDFDFGFNGNQPSNEATIEEKPNDEATDIDTGKTTSTKNGEETVDIDDTVKDKDDKDKGDTDDNKDDDKKDKKDKDTKEDKDELLEEGTIIEYGDKKYTVDKDGNLVKEDGSIFKKADKVTAWLKSHETEETVEDKETVVDVKAVRKALGVDIVDEDGKAVEFDNTVEGLTSYVNAYVEHTKQQIQNDTIDALYSKYPILENVINYYVANGNSLEGFNELRDRSSITLDPDNEAQCEAIVREAWKEDNRRGSVDSYIQYLKAQNLLSSTAQEELQAMIAKDKAASEELAHKAEETEKQRIEEQTAYWNDIKKRTVTDKRIGKYQIPDTIIRTHNGQRTSATPEDFFNYIYQVNKDGHSRYELDLMKEAKENPEARIVDDMLAAYLKFTGGSYESLVNMAVNEHKVKTIKIKSKTNSTKAPVKINRPTNKPKEIDFGY